MCLEYRRRCYIERPEGDKGQFLLSPPDVANGLFLDISNFEKASKPLRNSSFTYVLSGHIHKTKLTSWTWTHLKKPPIAHLLKNFPTLYGTLHWSLSWAKLIPYMSPHPISLRSILLLWHICWKPSHVARQWHNKERSNNETRHSGSRNQWEDRWELCFLCARITTSCNNREIVEAMFSLGPCGGLNLAVVEFKWLGDSTHVEAGSNTSTVTLRVVGGDEKGSLKSETIKYGRKSQGTRTRGTRKVRDLRRWEC
jgi:hypothetical protein